MRFLYLMHFPLLFCSVTGCVQLFATPWTAAYQASLSLSISQSLPKFMSNASVMPSSHLILSHPLLPLPSILPCIRVFSNELSVRIRWPKYWSFSFSISPSNEYLGLISLKIDWLYLFAVQGTLRSLPQHYTLKAWILWNSAFFTVQVSQPYVKKWEDHSFDYMDLCWQKSLPFNTLSRVVIAFLPRSNHLLISWLQLPSAVILEPKKRKSVISTFFPSICHEIMGPF